MLRHLTNQSMIAESHLAALQAVRLHPFFLLSQPFNLLASLQDLFSPIGVCSSRALAPNFCSWATRKSQFFHTNHMLGTLDFTGSEHWAPFNFP